MELGPVTLLQEPTEQLDFCRLQGAPQENPEPTPLSLEPRREGRTWAALGHSLPASLAHSLCLGSTAGCKGEASPGGRKPEASSSRATSLRLPLRGGW